MDSYDILVEKCKEMIPDADEKFITRDTLKSPKPGLHTSAKPITPHLKRHCRVHHVMDTNKLKLIILIAQRQQFSPIKNNL
nr:unnamed protein product [Callosobruchus analis]